SRSGTLPVGDIHHSDGESYGKNDGEHNEGEDEDRAFVWFCEGHGDLLMGYISS
ncbi:MAG: hypothetical protein QG581_344, partial [Patescibacteria group bacterium]|nr:hypothetical protein [Patescibacteria group bacterium]